MYLLSTYIILHLILPWKQFLKIVNLNKLLEFKYKPEIVNNMLSEIMERKIVKAAYIVRK